MKTTHGRTPAEVLTIRESGREYSKTLRGALRAVGMEYRCAICSLGPVWNGRALTLQADHIDGNPLDCRIENLRFLCPNCHTQTETFCSVKQAPPAVEKVLTYKDAADIRERYGPYRAGQRRGDEVRQMAREYGVAPRVITRIVSGQTFR